MLMMTASSGAGARAGAGGVQGIVRYVGCYGAMLRVSGDGVKVAQNLAYGRRGSVSVLIA